MKVRISFLSLEYTAICCQILQCFSPDRGCLEGLTPIQSTRQYCVVTGSKCYIYIQSLHISWSRKLKKGFQWVIENVVKLVRCFIKACDCTLVSLLACSDCQWHSRKLYFPYVPTCLEGVSAVWAVKSDMTITSKDWEQNEGCQSSAVFELMKKDKRLHTGQNNVCCSEQAGLVGFDACTQFQQCFVWLCTVSLICFSTHSCPENMLHMCNRGSLYLQTTLSFMLKLILNLIFMTLERLLVCFLCSRGSDDLVVRSEKVKLQCINWIYVRTQDVLYHEFLAAAKWVHSSGSLFGLH